MTPSFPSRRASDLNATVENAGSVGGNLTANAGNGNTNVTEQGLVFDSTGALILSDVYEATDTRSKGSATVVVAATGEVDGTVFANATQDVAITNAGTIGGGVSGNSSGNDRSEEHTSELQSLMRISYAVFCLKKKKHILESTTITRSDKLHYR